MGDRDGENYIQRAYDALAAWIHVRPFNPPPGGPGRGATPNMRLCELAIDLILEKPGSRDRAGDLGESQADPKPGRREGIGIVDGGFEQSPVATPGAHDAYHLLPSTVIALAAHQRGDAELCDGWLRVLGRWYASWRLGSLLPEGEGGPKVYSPSTLLPGTRWWRFKGQPPVAGADGLVHKRAGETPHQVTDACYRLLAGVPQRDNKGGQRPASWILERGEQNGWAAVQALYLLEAKSGRHVPRDLDCVLYAPVERAEVQIDGGGWRRRLWIRKPAEGIAPWIQGFCPAVQVTWMPGQPLDVAWAPNVVPDGFATGAAAAPAPRVEPPPPPPAPPVDDEQGVWIPRQDVDRLVGVVDVLERLRATH